MNTILLLVVVLAGKAAANPLPTDKEPEKHTQSIEPTDSSSCTPSDGSGYDDYWLSKRCYDLTTASEEVKEQMNSTCPMLLKQQNQTYFPNMFNHETPEQALEELEWLECLLNDDCHHHIQDFLCHIYFPPCIDDICTLIRLHPGSRILNPEPIYPCRSMCSRVTKNCASLLDLIPSNTVLYDRLRCINYPKEAPCIAPVKWVGKKPEEDNVNRCGRVTPLIGNLKHFSEMFM